MNDFSKIKQLSTRLDQIEGAIEGPLEDLSSKLDQEGRIHKISRNMFSFLARFTNTVWVKSGVRSSETLKVGWLKQTFDWIDKGGVEDEINELLKSPTKEGYAKLLEIRDKLKSIKASIIYAKALGKMPSKKAEKVTSLFNLFEHIELRPFALKEIEKEIEMGKAQFAQEAIQTQETLDLSEVADVFDEDYVRAGVEVAIDGYALESAEGIDRTKKLKTVNRFLDLHIGNKNQKWKEAIRKLSTQFLVKRVSGDADTVNSIVGNGFTLDPIMGTVKYKEDGYRAKINVKLEKNSEKEITKAIFEVTYEADWTYNQNGKKEVLKTEKMAQTFSLTNEADTWSLKPVNST